jgi:aminopeptidase
MERKFFEKYADLLVSRVGLQAGQNLLIRTEPVHYELAGIIAEAAYKHGAQYVEISSNDIEKMHGYRARIENSKEEYLSYLPNYKIETWKEMVKDKWALIALKGEEDPDFLAGLDQARNSVVIKTFADAGKPFRKATMNDEIQWLVAFAPSEKMAGKIMDMPAGKDAQEKLWEVLKPILLLDKDDPASEWRKKGQELKKRSATLTDKKLKEVHFKGPGTDLTIGLAEQAQWMGGPSATPDGVEFSPNIPTEEVFTTPDYRIAEGRVQITRPVLVPVIGKMIYGAWLVFQNGEVVEWGADEGKDVLDTYFELDPQAKFLGELALVDSNSPIYQADRTFYNILFDENASCHIALGAGYPGGFKGADVMSDEELMKNGVNVAKVHTDFMIGSPEVDVTGTTYSGEKVEIIKDGVFVI